MNKRIEHENSIIYLVEDYKERQKVTTDLEDGKRVCIIAKEEDILSFYGLLLEQYGQYNLYQENDFKDVDEDYIDYISNRDETKEEAIKYVGKPLSQIVSETIDSLKLDAKQKRIMEICKEVLKGSNDIKQDATINLLNERLKQERALKESLQNELSQLKTTQQESITTTQFVRSSILLDSLGANINTSVMYIREYSDIPYLHTCIRSYCNYYNIILGKRAKMVIFDDDLFDIKYNDCKKIATQEEYMGNRTLYMNSSDSLCCYQLFPHVVDDLYKCNYDLLIIIDRILNKQDLVKGKNVHKYISAANKEIVKYLNNLPNQDFTYITTPDMEYPDSIIIRKIKQDVSDSKKQLYWFQKIPNGGNDTRLIFDIFNEKNTNAVKNKRII